MPGDYTEIEGTTARCARCGNTTESYGTDDRSVRRCLVLLRETCPRRESNFYEPDRMSGFCRHGLDQASCADCRPTRALITPNGIGEILNPDWAALFAQAQRGDGLGRWITAQYDGICRGCGERWEIGDLIRFAESEGGFVCRECGSG